MEKLEKLYVKKVNPLTEAKWQNKYKKKNKTDSSADTSTRCAHRPEGSVIHGNVYFRSDMNISEIRGHFSTDKSVAIEKRSKTAQNRDWSDRAAKPKP
jgi:hypothetical protein